MAVQLFESRLDLTGTHPSFGEPDADSAGLDLKSRECFHAAANAGIAVFRVMEMEILSPGRRRYQN